MFQAVLNAVLVCHHRRTTFPVTAGRTASALRRTYIVCLDCGAELLYDWKQMRVIPPGAPANGVRLLEEHPTAPAAGAREAPCEPVGSPANPPEVRVAYAAPVERPEPAPNADRPCAASVSSEYLVRAKLRMQQVQVALRVLNALMAGLSAQPDDEAKLRAWAKPGEQACSARDLAQRVVACAVSP